jgi:HPt (histidine-containing phosphotransfer) domain-containing protein
MDMTLPLIDLSYVEELSCNETDYMYEIINIFISTNTSGLVKLEKLIKMPATYDEIQRQAHFLKSSSAIIKVRNNHEHLVKIDAMMKAAIKEQVEPDMNEVKSRLDTILSNYEEALPMLKKEMKKYKPKAKKTVK